MKPRIFAFFALTTLILCSCTAKSTTDERFYMDTFVSVTIPDGDYDTKRVIDGAFDLTAALEAQLSVHSDGDIARFNESVYGAEISPETAEVMAAALDVAQKTGGAYDPTLYPLTSLWNIAHGEAAIPSDADIKAALDRTGYTGITLDGLNLLKEGFNAEIDLGGAAKGYACGAVIAYLKASGVEYGMVSFGGNVGMFGDKPDGSRRKIGVRDPFDSQNVIGYLYLKGENYVSVSGDYERYFELDGKRYHHILDPATGYPSESGVHSAAVIMGEGMGAQCDALSTALFVLGADKAKELYESGELNFEAIIVSDGETYITDGLKDIFEPIE